MLYHVTFSVDRQALGASGNVETIRAAEIQRAAAARDAGRLIGLWRRADGDGVIFILDVESHDALLAELSTLPLFPYLRKVDVIPLVAYPGFSRAEILDCYRQQTRAETQP